MKKTGIMLTTTGIGAGLGLLIGGLNSYNTVNGALTSWKVGYLSNGNPAMPDGTPMLPGMVTSDTQVVVMIVVNLVLGLLIGAGIGLLAGCVIVRVRTGKSPRLARPGWYQRPEDATWGYWDGSNWIETAPAPLPSGQAGAQS